MDGGFLEWKKMGFDVTQSEEHSYLKGNFKVKDKCWAFCKISLGFESYWREVIDEILDIAEIQRKDLLVKSLNLEQVLNQGIFQTSKNLPYTDSS